MGTSLTGEEQKRSQAAAAGQQKQDPVAVFCPSPCQTGSQLERFCFVSSITVKSKGAECQKKAEHSGGSSHSLRSLTRGIKPGG